MAKQQKNTKQASPKSTSKKEAKVSKLSKQQKALVKKITFTTQARSIVLDATKSAKATISLAKTVAQTFVSITKTAKGNEDLFKSLWKKFTSTVKLLAGALSEEDANNLSSQISQLKRLMEWKPIYIKRFAAGKYGQKFTLSVGKKHLAAKGSLSDVRLLSAKKWTFDADRVVGMVIGMCRKNAARVRQVGNKLLRSAKTL